MCRMIYLAIEITLKRMKLQGVIAVRCGTRYNVCGCRFDR